MTTYDDTDLFTEAFTDFRDVGTSRQRPRLLGVLALGAAALLVVGALVWVRMPAAPAAPVDPATLVTAFGTQQGASDLLADEDLAEVSVYPETTRFLVATPTTRYFAAVAPGNQLCLLAIPAGDLPRTSCAPTGTPATVTLDDAVALVPAGATAPTGAWTEDAPNVYTRG